MVLCKEMIFLFLWHDRYDKDKTVKTRKYHEALFLIIERNFIKCYFHNNIQ